MDLLLATSSKEDLHRRIGGRCSTHNMKIVFKVCCKQEETTQKNSSVKAQTTSTTALSKPIGSSPDPTTPVPTTYLMTKQETLSTKKPTKKSGLQKIHKYNECFCLCIINYTQFLDEYDKHPNEVVKNEELTYNSGVWLSVASPTLLMLIVYIVCWRWR